MTKEEAQIIGNAAATAALMELQGQYQMAKSVLKLMELEAKQRDEVIALKKAYKVKQ